MNNTTKQTKFIQLTSLIRERLNLRNEGKLSLSSDDNLLKKVQKLTRFIYNNAEVITQKEMADALDMVHSDTKGYVPTTFEQRKTTFDYYQKHLTGFAKAFPLIDDVQLFLGQIQDSKEFRMVAVGHVPTRLHRDGKFWSNRSGKMGEGFSKFTMISAFKAYGLYKLYQLMVDAFKDEVKTYSQGEVEHPGFSLKDLEQLFTSDFQSPTSSTKSLKSDDYFDPDGIFKTLIFEDEQRGLEMIEAAGYSVAIESEEYTFNGHGLRFFLNKETICDARNGEVNSFTKDYARQFVEKIIMKHYHNDHNVTLINQYVKDSQSTYASSFMTKKNIPEKIQYVMSHSSFKKDFNFVEYDESIDLSQMGILEQEWPVYATILPQPMNGQKADLRFRRLGKHKARGIFFPAVNSIGVDPNQMSDGKLGVTSFSHEYGHFLDFNHTFDVPLSLQEEFQDILSDYQVKFDEVLPELTKKKADYFKTPTEVFARSFEVYLNQFSNLLSNFKKEALTGKEYLPLQENLLAVQKYFNALFPGLSDRLEHYHFMDEPAVMERKAGHILKASSEGVAASREFEADIFVEQLSLFDL